MYHNCSIFLFSFPFTSTKSNFNFHHCTKPHLASSPMIYTSLNPMVIFSSLHLYHSVHLKQSISLSSLKLPSVDIWNNPHTLFSFYLTGCSFLVFFANVPRQLELLTWESPSTSLCISSVLLSIYLQSSKNLWQPQCFETVLMLTASK